MSGARMIHPGPREAKRVQVAKGRLRTIEGRLPAGRTVMAAVDDLFAEAGCRGGVVYLDGVECQPMRFVLPALSTDGLHAAWYSDIHAPEGRWRILRGTATVGAKDGAGFLHCHGIWAGEDEKPAMGHLLPFDSLLAADADVRGIGSPDARFESLPDEETAFTLFQPQGDREGPGLLARIRPGEDVVTAVEALCAAHGISDARLHGVGSIDHIRFREGGRMDCLATELRLLETARLTGGRADIGIEAVDIDGNIASGTLTRGDNPVGVTLELLIEPTGNTT